MDAKDSGADKKEPRPPISEPIKRQVRQACYFGCVLCGNPMFHYDHVVEYSEVKEHKADNIALLCPNHHNAKSTGKLSRDRIEEGKKNPFNKGRYLSGKHTVEAGRDVYICAGSNKIVKKFENGEGTHISLGINGFNFAAVHAEGGWVTASLVLTDPAGNLILHMDRGELQVSPAVWDYSYEGHCLQIREGHGKIILELNLTNQLVEIKRGTFLHEGRDGFVISPDGVMHVLVNGKFEGVIVNTITLGANGGWAIWNRKMAPNAPAPRPFDFAVLLLDKPD